MSLVARLKFHRGPAGKFLQSYSTQTHPSFPSLSPSCFYPSILVSPPVPIKQFIPLNARAICCVAEYIDIHPCTHYLSVPIPTTTKQHPSMYQNYTTPFWLSGPGAIPLNILPLEVKALHRPSPSLSSLYIHAPALATPVHKRATSPDRVGHVSRPLISLHRLRGEPLTRGVCLGRRTQAR